MKCYEVNNNKDLADFVAKTKLDIDNRMTHFIKILEEAKNNGSAFAKSPLAVGWNFQDEVDKLEIKMNQVTSQVDQSFLQLFIIFFKMNSIKKQLHGFIDKADKEIKNVYTQVTAQIKKVRDGFKEVEGRVVQIMGDTVCFNFFFFEFKEF